MKHARGFTLIEVIISLAILGISLGALLTSQASSLDNAARARDITIATLLTRSKMIDIEQELFDEGFTEGEDSDNGDFGDEGHDEIKWESKISEIEMDLTGLLDMCSGFGEGDGGDEAGGCEGMLGGMGGMLEGFVGDLGRSLRLVELTVTWPIGTKYTDSISIKTVVTREDLGLQSGPAPVGGMTPERDFRNGSVAKLPNVRSMGSGR